MPRSSAATRRRRNFCDFEKARRSGATRYLCCPAIGAVDRVINAIDKLPYSRHILRQMSDPATGRGDPELAMTELPDSSTSRLNPAVDPLQKQWRSNHQFNSCC